MGISCFIGRSNRLTWNEVRSFFLRVIWELRRLLLGNHWIVTITRYNFKQPDIKSSITEYSNATIPSTKPHKSETNHRNLCPPKIPATNAKRIAQGSPDAPQAKPPAVKIYTSSRAASQHPAPPRALLPRDRRPRRGPPQRAPAIRIKLSS